MNILIVEARYHPMVSDALVDGATEALQKGGARFTRAVGARRAGNSRRHRAGRARWTVFDGYVALGSLLLAGGPHIDIMTQKLLLRADAAVADQGLCIGNGIVVAADGRPTHCVWP